MFIIPRSRVIVRVILLFRVPGGHILLFHLEMFHGGRGVTAVREEVIQIFQVEHFLLVFIPSSEAPILGADDLIK